MTSSYQEDKYDTCGGGDGAKSKTDDSDSEENKEGSEEIAGLSSKTPVSMLQEMCVRSGLTPKYDLLQVEGAIHEPVFKFRVTVGNIVATGCGNSKKKAKHTSATAILSKLNSTGQIEFKCNYDDEIKGNPVGCLQEMCMARRLPPPTYGHHHEEGKDHQKSFTINCSIGDKYKETGIGKNKKLAKRQAAHNMIDKLRELPVEKEDLPENLDDDELAQGQSGDHSELEGAEVKSQIASKRVCMFHKNLKFWKGKCVIKLHQSKLIDETAINYVGTLEEVAKEQHFEVTYIDIEEVSKRGLYQSMVQLSTVPVALCFGHGTNQILAKQDAARDALAYIQLMTK